MTHTITIEGTQDQINNFLSNHTIVSQQSTRFCDLINLKTTFIGNIEKVESEYNVTLIHESESFEPFIWN